MTQAPGARFWFIGPFPPPLSGQSHYNQTLIDLLEQDKGVQVTRLTTGERATDKIRLAVTNALTVLVKARKGDTVYTSAPGQMGLWLFLAVIAALRLRGLTHFVHHHSFRSINLAPMASHRWLARIGGPRSRHVFLSQTMCDRYAEAYLSPAQTKGALVVPNAFLFAQDVTPPPRREGPITIGHLSVMTREKGVGDLLSMFEHLLPDTDYRFVLAGPIRDDGLRAEVEAMVAAHPDRVEWIGPVQGEAKASFYARTDLFVLPSKLIDEADPLVLLEAFAAGTVALASNRGCIPDRVIAPRHLMDMDIDADVTRLKAMATDIAADRTGWASRAQDHARRLFAEAAADGQAFLAALKVAP